MNQTAMCFDRPNPDELFKTGSQCHRLLNRLLRGPVTNGEIIYHMRIANSTGRISDLREKLRPYLMDVEARHNGDRSEWIYKLVG